MSSRIGHGCLLALLVATDSAQASDTAIEEIIVTARKRSEHLREVPLAIDVLGQSELRRGSLDGLSALSARLPGLTFDARFGGANPAITLRGQTQITLAGDNVGVFVDGVYQISNDNRNIEPLDIARVEVARGPQSTLFGHSTFAGAIHYISADPTDRPAGGISLDGGSDSWRAVQGWVSGPVWGPLRARLALSARVADGTYHNTAPGGGSLGDFERIAAAFTLATDDRFEWSATLRLRYMHSEAGTPAFESLDYTRFNCGGRVPSPAAWSYFCGQVPVTDRFDLSPGLPDGSGSSRQAVLKLSIPFGDTLLESVTSWHRGHFNAFRDVDGSSAGDLFGVCRIGINCSNLIGGPPRPVDRLVRVNILDEFTTRGEELEQELRLSGEWRGRWQWMLGVYAYRNQTREPLAFSAVERDGLAATEQLAAYQPGDPLNLGPVSILSRAMVDDPVSTRLPRNGSEDTRRAYGGFATLDYALTPRLTLRAEARASRERVQRDGLYDSFRIGIRKAVAPVHFNDVTPRFSIAFEQSDTLNWYVSLAKGSRSGGVNLQPNLAQEERSFEPETNWTHELGMRWASGGLVETLNLTAFHIDWDNTQIPGFSTTPGVAVQVVKNTAGVKTDGIETSVVLRPSGWLRLDAAYTWIDARFNKGSDSPGDNGFCGISTRNTTSTFCTLGPPRAPNSAGFTVVPYLDGNRPARFAREPWHVGASIEPARTWNGWGGWLRVDLSHQGNMADRPVGGLEFGARDLLNARLGFSRGAWSVELWGRNLTDELYVSATAPGYAALFPTQPRPIDLFYADGRRIGVTLRYETE